jgi:hypothetical protein
MNPQVDSSQITSQDVFDLFEHLVGAVRSDLGSASPIAFQVSPGEVWYFDPASKGRLFSPLRGQLPPGTLLLRCREDLLARLVTDPSFQLTEDDNASYEGNVDALVALASALEKGRQRAIQRSGGQQ